MIGRHLRAQISKLWRGNCDVGAWSSCETMWDCKVLQEHGELEIIIVIHNVIVCLVNAITRLRQVAV